MNGKPACQMVLPSSVLSRHLEHKIKHTNDGEKRKEDTRRKTTPLNSKKKSYFVWRSGLFRVCNRIQNHKRDLSYKMQTQSFSTVLRRNVLLVTGALKYPEH